MIDLQRIFVKIFATPSDKVSQEDFVPVFHSFIKEKKLGEVWVDVTNYAHVQHGPGVVLIAHHAQYAMDEADGRLGLLYSRKRGSSGTLTERFSDALMRAHDAARELASAPSLQQSLTFRGDELLIGAQDKLLAPNSDKTLALLHAPIAEALENTRGKPHTLTRIGDPRGPFTLLASPR
ncbi:MAG: hypothetical protein IPK60_19785 [Sandaracinaceae bacterium]|nr:hypothetical protein [Sandaracinaceae bacterium]